MQQAGGGSLTSEASLARGGRPGSPPGACARTGDFQAEQILSSILCLLQGCAGQSLGEQCAAPPCRPPRCSQGRGSLSWVLLLRGETWGQCGHCLRHTRVGIGFRGCFQPHSCQSRKQS